MRSTTLRLLATAFCALLLAACASYPYDVEDGGDGVYYAEAPPDYVYADYGLYPRSYWPWVWSPYLYPLNNTSLYVSYGGLGYYPAFGIGYPYSNPYHWNPPLVYASPRHPVGGHDRRGRRHPGAVGHTDPSRPYRPGARPSEPAFSGPAGPRPRMTTSAPVTRAAAAPRSRPPRTMRPAPAPKPSLRTRPRDID
jgi:hypothetical protein